MQPICYNVLFLCTSNSARSIMAESILTKEGSGLFKTFSAGTNPKGEIHTSSLKTLNAFNFNIEGYNSKKWDIFEQSDAPEMDFIITVCDDAAKEIEATEKTVAKNNSSNGRMAIPYAQL